jgi:hypothetical protein
MLSSALRAFLGPAPVACPEGQMLTGSCAQLADIIVLITTENIHGHFIFQINYVSRSQEQLVAIR